MESWISCDIERSDVAQVAQRRDDHATNSCDDVHVNTDQAVLSRDALHDVD